LGQNAEHDSQAPQDFTRADHDGEILAQADAFAASFRVFEVVPATVAVGRPGTPTPKGSFYVLERLYLTDPSGPYGPGALGLSSFSPVLTGWTRGGPIAIHGTDAPDMLGFAVSHGCVRVSNAAIRVLLRLADDGTPVEIRL
jgi:lipoprotein-anchoring transpeptidase ErfK/SrfK